MNKSSIISNRMSRTLSYAIPQRLFWRRKPTNQTCLIRRKPTNQTCLIRRKPTNQTCLFFLPKISYSINLKFLVIVSFIFAISFLAFYVFQISSVISQGYQIHNYQKKIDSFAEENKILEINSVKINSLGNVESQIQQLGFEKVDKIHYIQILESSVVTADNKIE